MSEISKGLVDALCKEVLRTRGFRSDTYHSYEVLESIETEYTYVPERIVIYISIYGQKVSAVVLMNPDDGFPGVEGTDYNIIYTDTYNYYFEKIK